MLIAALIIGAISAYYLGLRVGGIAAITTFALFVLAIFWPAKMLWIYGLVALYTILIVSLGPRLPGQKGNKADFMRFVRALFRKGLQLIRKFKA